MSWYTILTIAYYTLITGLSVGILMENRNPMKTMSHVLMLYLIPIGGLVFYFVFGQNYRKRKLFSRKGLQDNALIKKWEAQYMERARSSSDRVQELIGDKFKVMNLLLNSDHSFPTDRNRVDVLRNGEKTFPAIEEAIRSAIHHIHIEYYIVEDDPVSRRIRDALIGKAQSGVAVRFIYDDVGSAGLGRSYLKPMKDAGIEVKPFMPVLFPFFTGTANYRNHRKTVIVDGRVGFLGGINLSARYTNTIERVGDRFWRDTHLRIEGDAVKNLQVKFLANWSFVAGKMPDITFDHFPEVESNGKTLVQIAASGPDSDWASIMSAIFMAVSTAREYVYITTPYFIPNDEIMLAIQTAAQSGVEVKMIIPSHSDSHVVHAATMSYVREMLHAGVEVYLYNKGFIHSKTIVIDGLLSTVGTANMDYRSFDINFELNAFIYDRGVAAELRKDFEEDLAESARITLERWDRRRFRRRLVESLARLVGPLL